MGSVLRTPYNIDPDSGFFPTYGHMHTCSLRNPTRTYELDAEPKPRILFAEKKYLHRAVCLRIRH